MNKPAGPDQGSPVRREPLLPNAVLAMLIFIVVEVMTFAGFISAFIIAKAQYNVWPPPNQPRLPIEATGLNTLALIASGVLIYIAGRKFAQSPKSARLWMLLSILLGTFFVLAQGYEWVQLLNEGLTLLSNQYGSFFYMIVGAHAIHAIAAILTLVYLYIQGLRDNLTANGLWAGQIFWYFVVGIWPLLYILVYDPFSG
ncbi:MAG: cytochrome c oxidase subunit 3 [Pirellulales bacterium]|nr:cytochrome c oxidase subunit 3 [Pirellulales bacterium]